MDSDKIIDGRLYSSQVKAEVKEETEKLYLEKGIQPGLAFILVGDNPASQVYVRNKGKACEEIGFHSVTKVLPEKNRRKPNPRFNQRIQRRQQHTRIACAIAFTETHQ